MTKWLVTILLVATLAALALLAPWWLPPLLKFVGANTDLIQGLTDLVQLLLWTGAGMMVLVGWLWPGRKQAQLAPVSKTKVKGQDQATIATNGGVAGGQVAVGRDVQGDVIIVADPDQLWQLIAHKRPPEDLRRATERYLTHLVDRYRYLDFKGMGVTDRVPLRLPLMEMYVPLKARIELPEGETWAHELRLAGRKASAGEAEAIGQRLSEPQPVLELLQQHSGLIILGDPGAGKTTFLKYLALRLAGGEAEALGLGARLPVLLPLSAYANALAAGDVPLDRFIATYYRDRGVDLPLGPLLEEALARGGVLLLLDGLDEVKDMGQRHTVVERVVDFFAFHRRAGNKFILTSRIVGYSDVRPTVEGLVECTLWDFEEAEITEFVAKWTAALERAARGQTPVAVQEAAQQQAELLAAVQHNPGVRRLAANPLLLTILALMKRQGVALPERRVQLYQSYIETLLKTWNLVRGLDRPASRDLDMVETVRVLAPLALWMHETSPGVGLVKQEAIRRKLEEIYTNRNHLQPEQAARQLLSDVREHAGLLLERGPEEYGFIHLTFQEYLAAVAIAQRSQGEMKAVVEPLAAHVGDDNWREVTLLTIGYMGLVQQLEQVAGAVVWELIKRSPAEPGQAVVLAGEAVVDAWPGGVDGPTKDRVRQALLKTMTADRHVKAAFRVAAGSALAKLGDPREGVVTLPPALTSPLRGTFLYGEKKERREVAPFEAGVYPVTNAQFGEFIRAGGYAEPRWWSEAGWQWRQGEPRYSWQKLDRPDYWEDSHFNQTNQPVVGVTWYEAEAFCRWLSAAYGREYRLPTEAEWERLARGPDGWEYPWSDVWQKGCANTRESEIGRTSAVGIFPGGVSPVGAHDCAGNVWEWCADWYDKEQMFRVLRGGSWGHDRDNSRCSIRYWLNPDYGLNFIGFRVVSPSL